MRLQCQPEGGSAADFAVYVQVPAHAASQVAADRESEPDALPDRGARPPELHERLEDVLERISRNPSTSVAFANSDSISSEG